MVPCPRSLLRPQALGRRPRSQTLGPMPRSQAIGPGPGPCPVLADTTDPPTWTPHTTPTLTPPAHPTSPIIMVIGVFFFVDRRSAAIACLKCSDGLLMQIMDTAYRRSMHRRSMYERSAGKLFRPTWLVLFSLASVVGDDGASFIPRRGERSSVGEREPAVLPVPDAGVAPDHVTARLV